MNAPILAPAAVLVLWSIFMLFWMAGTRLPVLAKLAPKGVSSPPGLRGADFDPMMPPEVAWKSHNYTHLMEQPTIFYATVAILALAGEGAGLNLMLAWGYVGLRIVHSIYQATINKVPVRFVIFALSTLCLLVLAVNAVRVTLGA